MKPSSPSVVWQLAVKFVSVSDFGGIVEEEVGRTTETIILCTGANGGFKTKLKKITRTKCGGRCNKKLLVFLLFFYSRLSRSRQSSAIMAR